MVANSDLPVSEIVKRSLTINDLLPQMTSLSYFHLSKYILCIQSKFFQQRKIRRQPFRRNFCNSLEFSTDYDRIYRSFDAIQSDVVLYIALVNDLE